MTRTEFISVGITKMPGQPVLGSVERANMICTENISVRVMKMLNQLANRTEGFFVE